VFQTEANKEMNLCKLTGTAMLAMGLFIGWYQLPTAQTATTQPTKNDLDQAQSALQKLMEQAPPITSPSLPTGDSKPENHSKVQPPPQVFSPLKGNAPQSRSANGQKIYPEGFYIADRRGRLIKGKTYWTFVFESDGIAMADPPIRILPNRWLEKMESDVTSDKNSIIFQVSGEVTIYHGENYLLLRKVLIERDSASNFK
jgi:hypothetical protein